MNLDKIDIHLNHLTPAQAVNLGFVTARRYYPTLFLSGVIAIAPVFLLAVLSVLLFDANAIAGLLIWWAKPFYDRVILLQGSRLLFRESVTMTDILKSLKTALSNGLFANLTWGRLSLIRGLSIPIALLEQQSGKTYRQRINILGRKGKSTMSSVTIGLLHFDMFLYINIFLLVLMFVPESYRNTLLDLFTTENYETSQQWFLILTLFFQSIICIVIEVFYVMIGFMLYLNSRVIMEGWGIELGFKRIAERLSNLSKIALLLINTIGLSVVIGLSVLPTDSFANTDSPTDSPTDKLTDNPAIVIDTKADKAILKSILQDPEINPYHTVTEWEAKNAKEKKKKEHKKRPKVDFDGAAEIIRLVIIGVVIIVAVILLYRYRYLFQGLAFKKKEDNQSPQMMFGLSVTPDSLPKNIEQVAHDLWQQGDYLGALSLLYRSYLSHLINDYNANIRESHTEGDCLRIGHNHLSDEKYGYFKQLTSVWQNVVYAHQQPNTDTVKALIDGWRDIFPKTEEEKHYAE